MDFPQAGDPYVSNKGTLVDPKMRFDPDYSLRVPSAKDMKPKTVRSTRELASDVETQTVVNAVLVYHILGVGANEIAHVLHVDRKEIDAIMSMTSFQETFEMMFTELLSLNSSSIQARIASMAGSALDNLFEIANEKPRIEKIKDTDEDGNEIVIEKKVWDTRVDVVAKANDSILDRAGLNAEQLFDNGKDDTGQDLQIEITTADDNKTSVKINTGRRT